MTVRSYAPLPRDRCAFSRRLCQILAAGLGCCIVALAIGAGYLAFEFVAQTMIGIAT